MAGPCSYASAVSNPPGDEIPTASWGRRILALVVDWVAATLVTIVIIGSDAYSQQGGAGGFVVLGVFVVEATLFTWLLGGSFGKLATGLRVVPANGVWRPINPLLLLLRQVLVALVIPPLVFRPNGRGAHDLVAGTATVTKETYASLIGT
ncbi:RDD family protein [soil metagenome]